MKRTALFLCYLFLLPCVLPASPVKPFVEWPTQPGGTTTAPFTKKAPAIPDKTQPWTFKPGKAVTVRVDATKFLAPVTPYSFGCNAAWWDGKSWLLSPDNVEKARQSGIRYWRWPGGSSAEDYHWDNDYSWHPKDSNGMAASNMNAPWAADTDDFIEFCRQTGSEALVTVNYSAARYGSLKKASDLATRWVRYFNREKKFEVRYWEIGNELYEYKTLGNGVLKDPHFDGKIYGKDFKAISAAMRKVDPNISIGAVAIDGDGAGDHPGYRWWMRDLLPELGGAADFLILHQYFLWPYDWHPEGNVYHPPTDAELLGNLPKLGQAFQSQASMQSKYAPGQPALPIALTEYNMVLDAPEPTIHLLNGLFTAEVLGEQFRTGYSSSNHWHWKGGFSKLKGDHALLSSSDPSVPDGTPLPSYYAFAVYSRAFGESAVAAESGDLQVKAYASRFKDGEIGLVLVNESPAARTARIDGTGFSPKGRYLGWVLTGRDLDAKRVSFNGTEGPVGGGGPFPIDGLPPYVGTFKPGYPAELNIPPTSVCGVVVY